MRNVAEKNCRENQNTRFIFIDFFPRNRANCEIIWKNVVQPDGPQVAV